MSNVGHEHRPVELPSSVYATQWRDGHDPWGWETVGLYSQPRAAREHRDQLIVRAQDEMEGYARRLRAGPSARQSLLDGAATDFRAVELRLLEAAPFLVVDVSEATEKIVVRVLS